MEESGSHGNLQSRICTTLWVCNRSSCLILFPKLPTPRKIPKKSFQNNFKRRVYIGILTMLDFIWAQTNPSHCFGHFIQIFILNLQESVILRTGYHTWPESNAQPDQMLNFLSCAIPQEKRPESIYYLTVKSINLQESLV